MNKDAMTFKASAKRVAHSPYKLRPLVDAVRGKSVVSALDWLSSQALKKVVPVKKVVESAVANAKDRAELPVDELVIQEIKVDQGPVYKYFKPGSRGQAKVQRKRFCHVSVVLKKKD